MVIIADFIMPETHQPIIVVILIIYSIYLLKDLVELYIGGGNGGAFEACAPLEQGTIPPFCGHGRLMFTSIKLHHVYTRTRRMSLQSSLDRFRTRSYQPEPGTSSVFVNNLLRFVSTISCGLPFPNELPPPML